MAEEKKQSQLDENYLGQPRDPLGRFGPGKQTRRGGSKSGGRSVSGTANRPRTTSFYQPPPRTKKPNRRPGSRPA